MGSVMAPGFCQTLYEHLKNTKRNVSYYDLILSGDLGIYGKKIAIEYMKTVYGLDISDNYEDSATLIFDKKFMKDYAGGSGPSCIGLVFLGYIFKKMKSSQLKKVLIIATGSLHSVVSLNQKFSIPTISHAISLESVK